MRSGHLHIRMGYETFRWAPDLDRHSLRVKP
jgi:hypothetical protein